MRGGGCEGKEVGRNARSNGRPLSVNAVNVSNDGVRGRGRKRVESVRREIIIWDRRFQ